MVKTPYPGGLCPDATPEGAFVVLYERQYFETHKGRVKLPPIDTFGPMFAALSDDGQRFAGQVHDVVDTVSEWDGVEWATFHAVCPGVLPIIYDHNGVRHINDGSNGSQGFRYVTSSNVLVTGDFTHNNLVDGLIDWTDLSVAQDRSIVIGQATFAFGAFVRIDGVMRVLDTRDSQFIRARRSGNRVSIAYQTPGEAVIVQTTIDELRALPVYGSSQPPIVVPPPSLPPSPPPQEPPPMPIAPNQLETVKAVFAAHPEINAMVDGERGQLTTLVVQALGGLPWGRKEKQKGSGNLSDDALCYRLSNGSFEIYDTQIGFNPGDARRPNVEVACWNYAGTFRDGENGYFYPVAAAGTGSGSTPGAPSDDLDTIVAARIAEAMAPLQRDIAALKAAAQGQADHSLTGKKIALRSITGPYVSADANHGEERPLYANREKVESWETFVIEEQP